MRCPCKGYCCLLHCSWHTLASWRVQQELGSLAAHKVSRPLNLQEEVMGKSGLPWWAVIHFWAPIGEGTLLSILVPQLLASGPLLTDSLPPQP